MKYLFSLVLILTASFSVCSQNPQLFEETWYLRYVTFNGEQSNTPLNENFNLILTDNNGQYTMAANGVENGLSGTVSFNGQTIQFQELSATLLGCSIENCDYEDLYFYNVLSDDLSDRTFNYYANFFNSGDAELRIYNNSAGVSAYYTNTPLEINPVLFQTWYLYELTGDLEPPFPVPPSIDHQLTINSDLTFTAVDNCIIKSGRFEYYEDFVNGFYLQLVDYQEDITSCTPPFGGLLNFGDEEIPLTSDLSDGNTTDYFYYDTYPGFGWYYRSDLLLTENQELNKVKIYPNPTTTTLIIEDINNIVASYSIIDFVGKTVVETQSYTSQNINVTSLNSGVYFVKLISEGKSIIKKIVKR